MKGIILAGGYATRLRPLTDTIAKPLLPLAGRPMIDYLCDKLAEVDEIDAVHVVTNARFAGDFRTWAEGRGGGPSLIVHDDGTTSNEDRLGAIGDIAFTVERGGLQGEDVLIVAGDNLFDYSLADLVAFQRAKGGSCIAVYEFPDRDLVRQYSVVELDGEDRVVSFVEKPAAPKSNLIAIATYVYLAEAAGLIRDYLKEGNSPDQPGNLVAWLHTRVPVYGYRFRGAWLDIGDRNQLLEADNRMRERAGLPQRAEYALN